jgi:hypothetical protein
MAEEAEERLRAPVGRRHVRERVSETAAVRRTDGRTRSIGGFDRMWVRCGKITAALFVKSTTSSS